MSIYKTIKPIVPGVFDNQTIWFGKENYRKVKDIGIIFDRHPIQDLYRCLPIYFVSEKFKVEFKNSSLSGILNFSLIRSSLFVNEGIPEVLNIKFYQIEINADNDRQTNFLMDRTKLLLDEDGLKFIEKLDCDEVVIEDFDPNWHAKLLEEDRRSREKKDKRGWFRRLFG